MTQPPRRRPGLDRVLQVLAWSLLALAVLWHGLAPIAGYDIWWQLATGREILAQGSSLARDPFSHSYAGRPWPYKDVGGALLFFTVHRLAGIAGLVVFKASIYLATMGLIARLLRRRAVPHAMAIAFMALTIASVAFRFSERPQILSFLLAAATLWVIDRHLRGRGDGKSGSLWWCLPITLVSANLHRAALVLPILVFAYLLALMWSTRRGDPLPRHALRDAALCGIGCSIACLLNPSGFAIVATSAAMIEDPLLHEAIPEWWEVTPSHLWAATPATVGVLVMLAGGVLARGRRQDPWDLVLIGLALAIGLRGVRFLPYVALLGVVPAAAGWATRPAAWQGRGRHVIAVGAALAVVLSTVASGLPGPSLAVERGRYPASALDFITAEQPRGPLYNDFAPGGYLIYHLAGGRLDDRVYIDGRNDILYEPEFVGEYVRSRVDPEIFDTIVERHAIQWLFLEPLFDDRRRAFVDRSPRWALVHVSDNALIYVRRDGDNAELAGRREFRALHPHELSATIAEAGGGGPRAEQLSRDIERWLAEEPDAMKARIAAAKLCLVLGPSRADELESHLTWLRQRGMEL